MSSQPITNLLLHRLAAEVDDRAYPDIQPRRFNRQPVVAGRRRSYRPEFRHPSYPSCSGLDAWGFRWDERKRQWTFAQRGIDLVDVLGLFDDPARVEVDDVRRDCGGRRFVILCPIRGASSISPTPSAVRTGASFRPARPMHGSTPSMSDTGSLTRAVRAADGRVLIEQPDGSFRVATGRTDWARLDGTGEAEIAGSMAADRDDPGHNPQFWERARPVFPRAKERVTMRLDADVVDWFRRQGAGYQTRINAILRGYVEHEKRGGKAVEQ